MQLDELKRSMSVLDHILDKTQTEIQINVEASQTAQTRLLKKYRQNIMSCGILAAVFGLTLSGGINENQIPMEQRVFLVIYLATAAIWYAIMYLKLKRMKIGTLPTAKLFSESTTIKLLNLTGEIVFAIGAAIFFTLFLQHMLATNMTAFWLCVGTLSFGVIWGALYTVPKYIKLFRDLNTLK